MDKEWRPSVPPQVHGLWRRLSMERPTGKPDDVTRSVMWLQSGDHYVDVRFPTPVPEQALITAVLQGGHSAALPPAKEAHLDMSMSGGRVACAREEVSGPEGAPPCPPFCLRWDCDVDYHPRGELDDMGRCEFVGKEGVLMLECGILEDYREVWMKLEAGGDSVALTLRSHNGVGRCGVAIVTRGWFGVVLDRTAATRAHFKAGAPGGASAAQYAEMFGAFGVLRWDDARGAMRWEVVHTNQAGSEWVQPAEGVAAGCVQTLTLFAASTAHSVHENTFSHSVKGRGGADHTLCWEVHGDARVLQQLL